MHASGAVSTMQIGRYAVPDAMGLLACADVDGQRDTRFVLPASDAVVDRAVQVHVAWRPRESGSGERYPLTPLAEARLLARLSHPGIVTVLDAGSDERFEFFVTPRIASDLERVLADHPAGVPVASAIEWMTQVAGTLDFVHRRGFAHRDVRPQNLFLDEIGRVRLGGFDLATAIGEPVDGSLVGTPRYMAPEDMLGTGSSWTSPKGDLWAIGVTLYRLLTGTPPFHGPGPWSLMRDALNRTPQPPSAVTAGVPRALDEIVLRCLQKDPRMRFDTAGACAEALRRCADARDPAASGFAGSGRVFISHSSEDKARVEAEIVEPLERAGVPTWYAKDRIESAAHWTRSILDGLESCEWFLVAMSPRAVRSEWVHDEIHWAVEKRPDRIVPVLMEPCDARQLHIRLARIQHLDFRSGASDAFSRLMALLTNR